MIQAGLVLEGGGMRGVYTAGVLDFFLDKDLSFERIYGVSAGACHACSFLSGQRRRAFDVSVDYLEDKRYAGLYSLITTGSWFGEEMVYDIIPNQLNRYDYRAQQENPSQFYAVVTNCDTGQPEYLPITDLKKELPIICASASLPFLSPMAEINGKRYLDGGMSDSIPLKRAAADGNKKNVVVLTRDAGYTKTANRLVWAAKLRYRNHPALVDCLKNRHIMYNQSLADVKESEERGESFVIRPKAPVRLGRLEKDRQKLEALYQDGYNDAKASYPALMHFLDSTKTAKNLNR